MIRTSNKNRHGGGMLLRIVVACSLLVALPALSIAEPAFDAAKAFGARPSVEYVSLSPDGMSVAYVAATTGQGSVVYVQSLAKGATLTTKPVLAAQKRCLSAQSYGALSAALIRSRS
jgi:hypothetical protein